MATHADCSMLTAALRYVELGYAVFPCRPGAKLPATGHGVLDATTDAEQIRRWWSRRPDFNIGLACNGLVVIDIDPDGLAWPGDEGKRQSIKGTGCPLQRTPRGGYHLLFSVPDGHAWRCSVGLLAPGVDVRTNGGFIVVAPSVVKGKPYRWIRPLVAKSQLPPPPGWLIAELDALEQRRQNSPPPGGHNGQPDVAPLIEGTRNSGLASLAGRLRRSGLSQPELEAALLEANRLRCRPPLPEKEVLAIARSIGRYPPGPAETSWAMQQAWRHAIEHRRRRYGRITSRF
jgi:hypothetical protein